MKTWHSAPLAVAAAALLALTTACGQEQGTDGADGQSVGNAAPADGGYGGDAYGSGGAEKGDGYGSEQGGGGEAQAAGQLAVWNSKELGKVVTDAEGMTLYRFDEDSADPPTATCAGDCAQAWPVVAADGAKPPPGVDKEMLSSVTRDDGTEQLTIGGWPMYRYAEDKKPGDVKGQGVSGTWFAAAPDGKKAAPSKADDAAGEAGNEAGGYGNDAGEAADQAEALPGLSTRKDPELGEVVIDGNGMTVYRFKKDSAWPMKSACTGKCLEQWPVVEPVEKNDTKGILKKGFVTFNRPDGLKQQTIDCWPLYTFAGDKKPGDNNGQGVGGTWYAVSPQGKLIETNP